MRSNVVLQRSKVKGLIPGPEEQTLQVGGRAGPLENRLDPEPRHLTAKRDGQRVQMRITAELEPLVGELPGLDAPVLKRNITDIRALLEKDLTRTAGERRFLTVCAQELVDVLQARALAPDDQPMPQHGGS